MHLVHFIGIAAMWAPTILAACDKWDVEMFQGDICGSKGESANDIFMDNKARACQSLSGTSVDLNSISVSGDWRWLVTTYDNGDCTCSNPLKCPKQIEIASDGTIKCEDFSGFESFSVEAVYSTGC